MGSAGPSTTSSRKSQRSPSPTPPSGRGEDSPVITTPARPVRGFGEAFARTKRPWAPPTSRRRYTCLAAGAGTAAGLGTRRLLLGSGSGSFRVCGLGRVGSSRGGGRGRSGGSCRCVGGGRGRSGGVGRGGCAGVGRGLGGARLSRGRHLFG